MTISNTVASVTHLGNGVNTLWAYGFKIPDSNSVVVTVIDPDAVETVLGAATFSISGIGSDSGGVVTYPLTGSPLANGYFIRIDRSVALTQTTGFSNQSGLINSLIESAFDKLTMIAQDTKALSVRVVAVSQSLLGYVSVAAGYAAQAAASAAYAAGVAAGNAVLFTAQTLTSGQKTQARNNIGALATTGGTITGPTTLTNTEGDGTSLIHINKTSATKWASVRGEVNGVARFIIDLVDRAGHFGVVRLDNTGAYLDTPIFVNGATGEVTFKAGASTTWRTSTWGGWRCDATGAELARDGDIYWSWGGLNAWALGTVLPRWKNVRLAGEAYMATLAGGYGNQWRAPPGCVLTGFLGADGPDGSNHDQVITGLYFRGVQQTDMWGNWYTIGQV